MNCKQIGPIEILTGKNGSRVPYSTSLLIKGKENSVLIDCGGGKPVFDYIRNHFEITDIYLTHYHLDHVWGAYLFQDANISINPYDRRKLADPFELAKASGLYALFGKEGVESWLERQKRKTADPGEQKPRWQPILNIADDVFSYDHPIDVAETTMTVIHTPGHTEGFCSPYFPEYGVLFVGDFDLTSFGPWYMDADSDIDQFFESAEKTLEVDAKYYVTAHHKGTFERKEYEQRLTTYMDKIREREENTKKAIQKGVHPEDIVYREIFYYMKNHRQNSNFKRSETLGIAKHIDRLIRKGYDFEDYFRDFIECHNLHGEFLNYKSEPEQTVNE